MEPIKQSAAPSKQLTIPFVYGSIAFPLSKKVEDYTHKWICYLRGVDCENLSYLIKRVVFHLHPSCGNPVREVNAFPFQIQQLGWGEFQIQLDVELTLPNYPIVNLVHQLKLHHTHTGSSQVSKKPLCSQASDQFVFPVPDEQLTRLLQQHHQQNRQSTEMQQQLAPESEDTFNPEVPLKTVTNYSRYFNKFDANDHRIRLEDAIKFVNSQIIELKKQITVADSEVNKLFDEVNNK